MKTDQKPPDQQQDVFAMQWTSAQPMVAAYIASVVRDYHDTEDLLQQVASIAFRKRSDYQPGTPFVPWVCTIARYELLRWRRDKARNKLVFSNDTINYLAEVQTEFEQEVDARQEALHHCFNLLDRKAIMLLELRYQKGLTPGRIAEKKDMKPGSVRVALHRIRALLEQCIRRRVAQGAARE